MCLINFQFHEHPNYKLIVAANRDEFYGRPTAPAHFWEDEPEVLAGRDLLQFGTWLGVTKQGRFAALTNFRDPSQMGTGKVSRGEIVRNYLAGDTSSNTFLESLHGEKNNYTGFNLLVGNPDELFYYSNIQGDIIEVSAGTHGLSNHLLDTPWPKVTKGKHNLKTYVTGQEKVNVDALFTILADEEIAQDTELPQTGVGLDLERKLSPLFIKTPDYGTRSSSVLLVDTNNHFTFVERTYEHGELTKENHFTFQA
ncbi:NRDE family protein [Sporosarcina sp. G11-34]|uniref:NRDE family protein n=1 Tax=Sporosarcina sp. G11-34 TaxID=2849605 RepID=UPI0022A946AA|nr:NRDE family protein [Sporosarcina sp. G11-34]MCZ2259554.1 NRDE family protein [Sporosarcina sp. G11-34]